MSDVQYRDRNHGYVPTPTSLGELRPSFTTRVGDPRRREPSDYPVALAMADELNRNGQMWWWAQVREGGGPEPEHWSHFEGWDVRVGLELRTWNERVTNDWKGRDEIRKCGEWLLSFNEQVVYGGDVFRDLSATIAVIGRVQQELMELPVQWREDDYRGQIEGRKVYYRDVPATMGHWMPDQGCVMVRVVEGLRFPPSAYDIDNQTGTPENPEYNYSEEWAEEVKVELLSPRLWWWRDRADESFRA